jgi:hypothetical protein
MKTSLPLAVAATLALGTALAAPASAATVKPAGTTSTAGYDVSYPQCSSSLPSGQAFGIVGVNGGKATTANPCLGTELAWAARSTGSTTQARAQLYLNTADPGQVRTQVTTWPSSGSTPYGSCTLAADGYGADDQACSWQYGYERARNDVTTIFAQASPAPADANPADYVWWLDVETSNTWETGSAAALANNRADLEGMVAYLTQVTGGRSGVYSTNAQWSAIAGTVPTSSSLYGLDSWMAGARTAQGAAGNCHNSPFGPGGRVTVSQYVSGGLDHDVSCV